MKLKKIFWDTPRNYFEMHKNEKLWLPPPQFYELNKISNFMSIEDLADFAKTRSTKGLTLFLPVNYACSDGMVAVLPGDEMYPDNPNEQLLPIAVEQTMSEFRKTVKKLHRSEYGTFYDTTLYINIEPVDGFNRPKQKNKL